MLLSGILLHLSHPVKLPDCLHGFHNFSLSLCFCEEATCSIICECMGECEEDETHEKQRMNAWSENIAIVL